VVAGIGAYLVAQGFLGTLPHESAPTCGALVLTILAISAPIAGFVALFGPAGTGLGAVLMVFIGNPFSGVTSAPEMLPPVARDIGQWLPPGAGAEVLRSTAYFDGNRVGVQLLVLLSWVAFGFVAIIAGHHTSSKVAAHSSRIRHGLTG